MMKFIIPGLVVVALIGIAIVPLYTIVNTARQSVSSLASQQSDVSSPLKVVPLTIQKKSIVENDAASRIKINVAYPEIFGEVTPENMAAVNNIIPSFITDTINQFKTDAKDNKGSPELADAENTLFVTYTMERADSGIVSMEFRVESYFVGAAHPGTVVKTITYDFAANKILALSDVFNPGVNYLSFLSDKTATGVMVNFSITPTDNSEMGTSTVKWIKDGTAPEEKNFQHFVITQKGLIIVFDPYQVAAGVAGVQRVEIPYVELTGVMKPEYLLHQ